MQIIVPGATGFIGGHVCAELLRAGHEVIALTRRPESARARLDPRIRIHGWDARAPEPLLELIAAADGVVNLAGEPIAGQRWTAAHKERIQRSRVEATAAVVAALRAVPPRPRVLANPSGVGYYRGRGDEEITEASPAGDDFFADVCREWEAAARAAEDVARVVILRIGVVLGREGGALKAMLPPFRLGLGGPLGSGQQWFPWVHVADVAGLFRFALEQAEAKGPINAVAPESVRMIDFCRALARVLHRPCWFRVPQPALRLVLGEMADAVLASARVRPAAAVRLGYSFRFPRLEEALRDLLGSG
ncbi:MAG: TIGR01777 family protein [Armatimonadetes bacterium]|nr:TIGR01777 family protein [Armatimonadota bacterium]